MDNKVIQKYVIPFSGEKPFKCPFCEKRFKQQAHVKVHQRLHTGNVLSSSLLRQYNLVIANVFGPCENVNLVIEKKSSPSSCSLSLS